MSICGIAGNARGQLYSPLSSIFGFHHPTFYLTQPYANQLPRSSLLFSLIPAQPHFRPQRSTQDGLQEEYKLRSQAIKGVRNQQGKIQVELENNFCACKGWCCAVDVRM